MNTRAQRSDATAKRPRKARKGVNPGRRGGTVFRATDEQRHAVRCLAAVGTDQGTIAKVLDISVKTLERHFRAELNDGEVWVNAKVGQGIAAAALGGDRTMMIFYAKARMGWRERDARVGFMDEQGKPAAVPGNGPFRVEIVG